jgi:hypothetical protein
MIFGNQNFDHKGLVFTYSITLGIAFLIFVVSGQYQLLDTPIFSPHDSFYPVTQSIFDGYFGLFNFVDNFKKNYVAFYLHTPDRIYIKSLFMLGFSPKTIQLVHIFTCYFLLLTGTFFSFLRIFSSNKLLVLVTLGYCFSPLMSIFFKRRKKRKNKEALPMMTTIVFALTTLNM